MLNLRSYILSTIFMSKISYDYIFSVIQRQESDLRLKVMVFAAICVCDQCGTLKKRGAYIRMKAYVSDTEWQLRKRFLHTDIHVLCSRLVLDLSPDHFYQRSARSTRVFKIGKKLFFAFWHPRAGASVGCCSISKSLWPLAQLVFN